MPAAHAQDLAALTVKDLGSFSIQQLADLPVTTAARRRQPLRQAAAAIYVITADDIRRAGARSLPEALRLAPNLEVARLNAYNWSITARGFNSPESANKLLVLINGRSVYSPLAGTVFWDAINVPVANIARIEVISGPGGSLWGANAVNGVIDVITKPAGETPGMTADAAGGPFERDATLRYSGQIAPGTDLAVTANGSDIAATDPRLASDITSDAWRAGQIVVRLDRRDGPSRLFAYGLFYTAGSYDNPLKLLGTNLWGASGGVRWERSISDGGKLMVHGTFSRDVRSTPFLHEYLETYDGEAQYDFGAMGAHRIVAGAEVKVWNETLYSGNAFHFAKPSATPALVALFGEDAIALNRSVTLTAGFKGEYNNYSGFDAMPNLRLSWQAGADTMLWAGVSRAVRTPPRIDRELEALPLLAPAPDFQSESVIAYQVGYRGQPTANVSLSLNGYYNVYDDLRTDEVVGGALPIMLNNGLAGHSYGVELWGKYVVSPEWRISFGADWLHRAFHLKPGHNDFAVRQALGQDPAWQAQLRSESQITSTLELDIGLRAVGAVTQPTAPVHTQLVPSYVEADAKLGWTFTPGMELAIAGYNLLHSRHLEANDPSTTPARYIPRYFLVSLRAHL